MSTSSESHIQSLEERAQNVQKSAKQVQVSESVSTLTGSTANQVQSLITVDYQSEKTISIEDILLNGMVENTVGINTKKDIQLILEFLRDYKDIGIVGKIKYVENVLEDLDNQYQIQGDQVKKQAILKIIEAFKRHRFIENILGYQQRRNKVLERAFQRSADIFHIGEDILRKNPDINGTNLTQQIEDYFKKQGVQLSKDHKEILKITATSLEKAKQKRQTQLEEIFQKVGVSMPKKLEDIERVMNTNLEIQFQEWKDYSVERGGVDYLDKVLVRNKDVTLKVMKQEGLNGSTQTLTLEQKEIIAWHLEGGVKAIQFNLTSHPTCIIHQFKSVSAYMRDGSDGHIVRGTGKIYIRSDGTEKEIQDVIEHEYQHFLHLTFIDPIETQLFHKSLDGDLDEYIRFSKRFGERNKTYHLTEQWRSMKDEIASYLERNGKLAPGKHGYLSTDEQGQIVKELYGSNVNYIYLFDHVLHELISRGAKNKDIVDIVRTSSGFEHAYTRLRQKYAYVVDLPIDIKHWKLKGIDEIITKLYDYDEAIGYDNVVLKKKGNAITATYHVKIGNTLLDFQLEKQTSDPAKIKTFLEDVYNKINSSPIISGQPDQNELKEFLISAIKNFGNAQINNSVYIDSTLTLHYQELGNIPLFDNSVISKIVLNNLFLNTNDAS